MKKIQGIGASEGIGIGEIYKYDNPEFHIEKLHIEDSESELNKFKLCLEESMEEIKDVRDQALLSMGEETAAIFNAHLDMLQDPELLGGIEALITSEKVNAEYAVKTISQNFIDIFQTIDDPYMRERAADIKDVSNRLMKHLLDIPCTSLSCITRPVIVLAKDLSPSDTAGLNKENVLGFITDIGGRTSHSAIMARTLEIPAVTGTKDAFANLNTGDTVILNGESGEVICHPSEEDIKNFKAKQEIQIRERDELKRYAKEESMTKDGVVFDIAANIGQPDDMEQVLSVGADGVGLFRTEFLYMGRSTMPSEEEQFEAYREVLEKMKGKPVVIRTLDIGGDKELDYLDLPHEMNPFLGNRALRLCFSQSEIFRIQLRALLRASAYGNLHIMLPMIATLEELRKAKSIISDVERELVSEDVTISGDYKLGMMIEVPAAALSAAAFAKEVDFFSIGTNDLIQYTFAADRMNQQVSYLYQPFHPALITLIRSVICAAHKEGKWVGICGEMGGEVMALPILIGLGMDEISMSASGILKTRSMAGQIDKKEAEKLVEKAMKMGTEKEVIDLVEAYMNKQ